MKRLFIASLLAFAPFTWALDQAGSQRLSDLQQRWAQIQYQTPKDKRADAFEKLAADASTLVHQHPGSAEPLIWEGIINSSWAGATGGLGALGKVKAAKASLEQAMDEYEKALLEKLYDSHPSSRQLATRLGTSHTAIAKRLRKYGIPGKH